MAVNDENTGQLARIEEKVDNILESIRDLKADMKESRDHRNDLDRRVTKLETKMDDVDTVKKAVVGVVISVLVIGALVAWVLFQVP